MSQRAVDFSPNRENPKENQEGIIHLLTIFSKKSLFENKILKNSLILQSSQYNDLTNPMNVIW